MVLLQLKGPLELFVKRREFLPGSGFLFRRHMTLAFGSDIKPQTFLPSFQYITRRCCANSLLSCKHARISMQRYSLN